MRNNSTMKNRRLQLESLEARNLLAVIAGNEAVSAPESTEAAVWEVNTLSDPVTWSTTDSVLSLREAIARSAVGDTIRFHTALRGGTITLRSELSVTKAITIDASSIGGITLDANHAGRAMYVKLVGSSRSVELKDMTFTNGYVTDTDEGGALFISSGNVTMRDCVVKDSTVGGSVHTGTTQNGGGGIYNHSGKLTMVNCAVTGNTANYFGGGIQNETGTLTMTNCLVAGNVAGVARSYGGGIYNSNGTVTLTNCTICKNEAGYGGGIYTYGQNASVTLNNSIALFNTYRAGGEDIYSYAGAVNAHHVLSSYTAWTTSEDTRTYNSKAPLFTDAASGDYTLCDSSQAVDAGDNTYVTEPSDLAGNTRIVHDIVDLGAYEFDAATPPKITVSIVVTYDQPTATELGTLPQSQTSLKSGQTVYAQIWLKNADNSSLGCLGGYLDFVYDPSIFTAGRYAASSNFSEQASYASEAVRGTISLAGGCCAVGATSYGVSSWALLGYVPLTVTDDGTSEIVLKTPSMNGADYPALALTRQDVGTLTASEIDYGKVTISVNGDIDPPTLLTGRNGYYASYGLNRHRLEWTQVNGAGTYELEYYVGGSWNSTFTSNTSAIIGGFNYGDQVQYRVRAVTPDGRKTSDWSALKQFYVCPVDVDGDGFIGPGDSSHLSYSWFSVEGDSDWRYHCDVDGDGFIGPGDRSYLSANWFAIVGVDPIVNPPVQSPLADSVDQIFESGQDLLCLN